MLKRAQGDVAENEALQYLRQHGLRLVRRNYQCKLGEIDLIMSDGTCLVFVEVRFRRNSRFGSPAETVVARKQQRLIRTAMHYLQNHKLDSPCRFDVIGISGDSDTVQVEWIKDAFQAF